MLPCFTCTVPRQIISNRSKNIQEKVEDQEYKEGSISVSPELLVCTASWQNSIFVVEFKVCFARKGQVSRKKVWKP